MFEQTLAAKFGQISWSIDWTPNPTDYQAIQKGLDGCSDRQQLSQKAMYGCPSAVILNAWNTNIGRQTMKWRAPDPSIMTQISALQPVLVDYPKVVVKLEKHHHHHHLAHAAHKKYHWVEFTINQRALIVQVKWHHKVKISKCSPSPYQRNVFLRTWDLLPLSVWPKAKTIPCQSNNFLRTQALSGWLCGEQWWRNRVWKNMLCINALIKKKSNKYCVIDVEKSLDRPTE